MKLFFQKSGDGDAVIILHGLLGSGDNWIGVARKLAEHYNVYLVDIRNHGRSPHDDVHTYMSIVEDINELMQLCNLRRVHLVGHSMGGKAAMLYSNLFIEKIITLSVIDIAPDGYKIITDKQQPHDSNLNILNAMLNVGLSKVSSRTEVDKLLSVSIPDLIVRQFIMKNLNRNSYNIFNWKPNIQVLINFLPEIMGPLNLRESDKFPVLFLKGEYSNYLAGKHLQSVSDFYPYAKINIVNNAGHWIHADQPDLLINALFQHFNSA